MLLSQNLRTSYVFGGLEEGSMATSGFCLCKRTSWVYYGDQTWACFCHCDDCRRNCGAPVVAWLDVPLENFDWTGEKPSTFESSKGVYRHFCSTCGSPIGFEADHYPSGMHLYAASLEQPEKFKPTFHVNSQSRLPWLQLTDELEKFDGTLLHSPNDPDGY